MKHVFLLGLSLIITPAVSCSWSIRAEVYPSLLALGDSYTIGTALPAEESFPYQFHSLMGLKDQPEVIARVGWSTGDLLRALNDFIPMRPPQYVTLLIGVNNQYRGLDFSRYEKEFPELLQLALRYAGGRPERVRVLSIPDYRFTPFGQSRPDEVSIEIDRYNSFAEDHAHSREVIFLDITDISRKGLADPALVAQDGLHLSETAYQEIAQRLRDSFQISEDAILPGPHKNTLVPR
jgi:acyl-CoA thioesterase-1